MDSAPRRTAATVASPRNHVHQKFLVLVLAEGPLGGGHVKQKDPVVFFASMCLVGENLLACTAWSSSRLSPGRLAKFNCELKLPGRWRISYR